jgi:hypothetical protein
MSRRITEDPVGFSVSLTVPLFAGNLYVRPPPGSWGAIDVVDATSGMMVGQWNASVTFIPAFSGTMMFADANGGDLAVAAPLQAFALPLLDTAAPLWSFTHGQVAPAPIVVGPHVVVVAYLGPSLGTVSVLDATTGHRVSSADVSAPIDGPDEFDNVVLTGLAAADGMLFVPARSGLVAY